MLKSAQYIEENNIIFDNENSFKKGKKAQVGFDVSVKNIYKQYYPGLILKNKTFVPQYIKVPVDTIKYPYTEPLGLKEPVVFEGWFLPKGTYLLECNEGVQFGANDTGYFIMRSSCNRCFVTILSALWDPGFTTKNKDDVNTVTLRLNVDAEEGIYLEKDARVAQLIVCDNEDTELYGTKDSQFQGGRNILTPIRY